MIYPFFKFKKNCEKAMIFYQNCFGGQLEILKISDSPVHSSFPSDMQDLVLRATLKSKDVNIMASDVSEDENSNFYSSIGSLLYATQNVEYLESKFEQISTGGKIIHSLEPSFFGTLHGEVKDKFNVNWIFFEEQN